jgi:hypothetical protein
MDTDETQTHQSSSKSFDASNAPDPDPTPPAVSKEEREGVPPDDMDARTPLGVGESTQGRGEDVDTSESGGSDRDAHRKGGTTEEF